MRAVRYRFRTTLAVLTLGAVAWSASGQPSDASRVALSGEVTLVQLVDLCASRLNLNLDFDRSQLTGAVSLRFSESPTDEQLWDLTNRLLQTRGFTTVKTGDADGHFSIVKTSDAASVSQLELDSVAGPQTLAGYRSQVVDVNHVPTKDAIETIQTVLGRDGTATAISESPYILVSGPSPRVDQAVAVLQLIDVPSMQPTTVRISLKNTPAIDLVSAVNAVASASTAVSGAELLGKVLVSPTGNAVILVAPDDELGYWRQLISEFDEQRTVETRSYTPRFFDPPQVAQLLEELVHQESGPVGRDDGWRVVTNEFTGALVVTATLQQHSRIAQILNELNTLPVETRRPIRTFEVRNRSVLEVVELLAELIEAGALDSDNGQSEPTRQTESASGARASSQADANGGSIQRTFASTDVRLTADDATSTIIAIGEPRMLSQLEQLIAALDVRQPQVMLEVLIVSMSDGESFDLGVELRQMGVTGDTLTTLTSLFGLSSTEGDVTPSLSDPRGGTAVILNPGDFSVVVRALETVNDGRSLNVPRVLVNNNEQATLDSVLQQPLLSVNASDTVATTSFGGTQDAGTQVAVTPQIAEGDHLLLEYTVTLSSFVGESSDPSLPPPRQQNTLASIATIPDGFVVAAGGLEVETEADAESKVPVLGDLPIVGAAFKNRSKSRTRSRFYVFIRPTILRHEGFADLRYISDEMLQQAGLTDDTWPVVKPQIIH